MQRRLWWWFWGRRTRPGGCHAMRAGGSLYSINIYMYVLKCFNLIRYIYQTINLLVKCFCLKNINTKLLLLKLTNVCVSVLILQTRHYVGVARLSLEYIDQPDDCSHAYPSPSIWFTNKFQHVYVTTYWTFIFLYLICTTSTRIHICSTVNVVWPCLYYYIYYL